MLPEELIAEILKDLSCKNHGLRPVLRDDKKWALKIGVIVESAGGQTNAATIWKGLNDRINVIIFENNQRNHIDWPDYDIRNIVLIHKTLFNLNY